MSYLKYYLYSEYPEFVMIKWGIHEEFSEDIGSSYLLCTCAISGTEVLVSSPDQTFYISGSQVKYSFPASFSAIYYLPDHELVIGSTTGITTLQIFSMSNPKNPYIRDFLLHQNLISQIYCSLASNILITVGGKDIKIWDIQMIKTSTITFNITQKASFPSSPLCSNGMNLISIDEKRHRIFVPHLNGFVLYSFEGKILEKQLKFSHFLFTAVSLLPSPRKYPGLDLSYYHFIDIFKRFAIVDSSANIHIYYKSGHFLLSISPIVSSSIIFISFVNSEFIVTVNTTGDICLVNIKTTKVKIVCQIGRKPDRVDFFSNPEPTLFVISGRKLFKYKINLMWRLFYRPVESVKSICRHCSPFYSARIGLLTSDGCVFMVSTFKKPVKTDKTVTKIKNCFNLLSDNYKNRFLVGAASTRCCCRPVSYSYNRDCNETNILISMDDSTVHLFDYINDDWYFKEILPIKSRLIFTFIGTELLTWCVCACGFRGDVCFYEYGTWSKISRISVGMKQCDFAFWSKKDGLIIVLCQNRLYVIGVAKFNSLYWIHFEKPQCASFEEGDLIVSYQHGVLHRYNVTSSGVSNPTESKFGNEITFVYMKYGCHIVVLKDNSIVIGNNQNIAITSIELPFQVFSVSFLSSDLDILVALDHEIMLIEKKNFCPFLHPTNVPPDDLDNSKSEPLFNGKIPIPSENSKNDRKYYYEDDDDDLSDDDYYKNYRKSSKEVLKRIRQKMIEDEENEFKFIVPDFDFLNTTNTNNNQRIKIIENRIKKKKQKEEEEEEDKRKPVQVITNPDLKKIYLHSKLTINEDGTKTFHYSEIYEQLRFQIENFLVIEENFSINRNEIPSIVAQTDDELDRIYNNKKRKRRRNRNRNQRSRSDFWFNEIEYLDFNSNFKENYNLYGLLKRKLKRSKSTNNITYLNAISNRINTIENSLSLSDLNQIDNFSLFNKNLVIYNINKNTITSSSYGYYESDDEIDNDNFFFTLLTKLKNELFDDQIDLNFKKNFSIKNNRDFASSSSSRLSTDANLQDLVSNKQISPILQSSKTVTNQVRASFPKDSFENMKSKSLNDKNVKTRKSFSGNSKDFLPSNLACRASLLSSQDKNKNTNENKSQSQNDSSPKPFNNVIESFEREERLSLKRPLSETQQLSSTQPSSAFESQSSVTKNENKFPLTLKSAQDELFNNNNYYNYQDGNLANKKGKKGKNKTKIKNKANQWKSLQKQQIQQQEMNKRNSNSVNKNNQTKVNNNNDDGLSSSFWKLLNSNQNKNESQKNQSNLGSGGGFNFSIDFHHQNSQIDNSINDNNNNIDNNNNNNDVSIDHNQTSIQIKEPSYAPMNLNSSRRQKRLNSSINDQNEFKNQINKNLHFDLLNSFDEEESEEKSEEINTKKSGRQLLINKDALALYDPMDVKKMIIRFDSNTKNQTKPPIKVKKSTQKRRIIIKRQQLSREKSPFNQNSCLY